MQFFARLIRKSARSFLEDECLSSAAAIAYYTIFSLPPLLIMLLALTNVIGFSREDVDRVFEQDLGMPVSQFGGEKPSAKTSQPDRTAPHQSPTAAASAASASGKFRVDLSDLGAASAILGSALLLFAATGMFAELQYALNKVWQVAPDPDQGSMRHFLFKRLLSATMVIIIWFGLLVSLILTAINSEILKWIWGTEPGLLGKLAGATVNELTTFALALVLFAAVFKILPDAKLIWRDVWGGAAFTAALFVIGKMLIGWYLRSIPPGAGWGTSAASTAAALMWVYYSSIIVLFGAEFTESWGELAGKSAAPEPGATRTDETRRRHRLRRVLKRGQPFIVLPTKKPWS